jgi:hypothetical protein
MRTLVVFSLATTLPIAATTLYSQQIQPQPGGTATATLRSGQDHDGTCIQVTLTDSTDLHAGFFSSVQPLIHAVEQNAGGEAKASAGHHFLRSVASVSRPAPISNNVSGAIVDTRTIACASGIATGWDYLSGDLRVRVRLRLKGSLVDPGEAREDFAFTSSSTTPITFTLVASSGDESPDSIGDFNLSCCHLYQATATLTAAAALLSSSQQSVASANYGNTAYFYIDSYSPTDDLVWLSGSSHSDPDFKRQAPILIASPSPPMKAPTAVVRVDEDVKIIGAGATIDDSSAPPSFLTYLGPFALETPRPFLKNPPVIQHVTNDFTWSAGGSSKIRSKGTGLASVAIQAVEFPDPSNLYDIRITRSAGRTLSNPSRIEARATVAMGFILASGGCLVAPLPLSTPGPIKSSTTSLYSAFLSGSYPDVGTRDSWICEAGDGTSGPRSNLTAFAVGIRPVSSATQTPVLRITQSTSPFSNAPQAIAQRFAEGFLVTGGGARAVPTTMISGTKITYVGNLFLTATVPVVPAAAPASAATGWQVKTNSYGTQAVGTVTAYALNILFNPPVLQTVSPLHATPGTAVNVAGQHFAPNMKIRFGTLVVPLANLSIESATAVVPAGISGTVQVVLLTGDVESNAQSFTIP